MHTDMVDVYASSTTIFTDAITQLSQHYLAALAIIVPVMFGFVFLWKVLHRSRKSVK